jgi:hypothetical protein
MLAHRKTYRSNSGIDAVDFLVELPRAKAKRRNHGDLYIANAEVFGRMQCIEYKVLDIAPRCLYSNIAMCP